MDGLAAAAAFLTGFFPPLSIAAANVAFLLLLAAAVADHLRGRDRLVPARTAFDLPVLLFLAAWTLASLLGLDRGHSLEKFGSQIRFVLLYVLCWAGGGRHRDAAWRG